MNILITNDDGIDAQGLQVLKGVLSDHYSVFTIAMNGTLDEKFA